MEVNNKQNAHKYLDTVLIVGCGYIGKALAEALQQQGVKVGALTRNPEQADRLRAMGLIDVVEAELDSREWHGRLTQQYRAVVNCVSSAGGGLSGYQKSYIDGQQSLLEWASVVKPEVICYTSSTSVYPQDGGMWVDESFSTESESPTAAILLAAEKMLMDAKELCERRYVLRLGGIYGPGRHYLIDQVRSGEGVIPGRGDYHLNMIHRDDAVRALLALLQIKMEVKSAIFNLCDDNPTRKDEIVSWMADLIGSPCPVFDPNLKSPRLQRRGSSMPDRKISNAKIKTITEWSPYFLDYRLGYYDLLMPKI